MINNITPRTAKPDALTSLLRSDLPDLGEIRVSVVETSPDRSGEADSLTLYLNQIARWARLGAEEELRLGRLIKTGKDADGSLTDTKFAELALLELAAPTSLTSLQLSGCKALGIAGLVALERYCPQLRSLTLQGAGATLPLRCSQPVVRLFALGVNLDG